ncbi:hypothetical protein KO495_17270, partial [Colwellia sp. D2M02]|uniref:hypothetical protein n=1 Tax=Colwellia sp. D2M02 TaxID=2841562 RepID=UPI001C0980D8
MYRLTQESITDAINGNYTASYTYDKVGNRLLSTINAVEILYSYDDNDKVLTAGNATYAYDDN